MGKQVKEGKKSPFRGQPVKVLRLANLSTSHRLGRSYALRGQCILPARPVVMI